MDLNVIVEDVKKKIIEMEDGDSSTIGALVGAGVDTKDLFEIQRRVIAELQEEGVVLDYSSHDGLVEGLPFNLNFIKKTRD